MIRINLTRLAVETRKFQTHQLQICGRKPKKTIRMEGAQKDEKWTVDQSSVEAKNGIRPVLSSVNSMKDSNSRLKSQNPNETRLGLKNSGVES